MPDLLREQFPHFRPIVEAFGYRNLEFEGWEADDVIATLATRADAGRAPDLRRLDRPRRVPALLREHLPDDDAARRRRRPGLHARARRGALRGAARPDPGLHRPQGRHVRQHPRHPRHRRQDRRAADRPVRLARGGDRARRRAVPGAREEHHRVRRPGAHLQGARDDAPRPRPRLRSSRARPRAARPLAAEGDLPPLRVPRRCSAGSTRSTRRCRRAAPGPTAPSQVPWREGALDAAPGRVGLSVADGRLAVATGDEVWSRAAPGRAPGGAARSARGARCEVARRRRRGRHAARRVPDRARAAPRTSCPTSAAEYGVELVPVPAGRRGDGALVRAPTLPRRLVAPLLARLEERGADRSLPRDRAAAHGRARRDGARRRQDRHVPDGRDHGPARRARRRARGRGVRARGRGVHDRLDPAGRADPLRAARARPPAARARPATRPTRRCSARSATTTRSCR